MKYSWYAGCFIFVAALIGMIATAPFAQEESLKDSYNRCLAYCSQHYGNACSNKCGSLGCKNNCRKDYRTCQFKCQSLLEQRERELRPKCRKLEKATKTLYKDTYALQGRQKELIGLINDKRRAIAKLPEIPSSVSPEDMRECEAQATEFAQGSGGGRPCSLWTNSDWAKKNPLKARLKAKIYDMQYDNKVLSERISKNMKLLREARWVLKKICH